VGEDPGTTRLDETIGYVVIEAGRGTIGALGYIAGVGGDSVRGMDNAPPYSYSISGVSANSVAIVSQTAMDGGNGGWASLHGPTPVSTDSLHLVIDEDRLRDSERKHTSEQVAYIVFD
jgi:hypothetical protein